MRAAQSPGTTGRGAASGGGKSPPAPKAADALVSRPTPESAARQLPSWAPPAPARAASPRLASPSAVRFGALSPPRGLAGALSPPRVLCAGALSPRASLPATAWPLLHRLGPGTAPAVAAAAAEPRAAPLAPVAFGGLAPRGPALFRWDLRNAPPAVLEAALLPQAAAAASARAPPSARAASPKATLACPPEPAAVTHRADGRAPPSPPPDRGKSAPDPAQRASPRAGAAEPRRRSSARAPPASARAARREAAQRPRQASQEGPGPPSPRAAAAGGGVGGAPCRKGEAAPATPGAGWAVSPRDDVAAGRQPDELGRSGGAGALERLRRDREELLRQSARLQERLLEAQSSADAAEQRAEEALAERDWEHARAESLQKSSQQLLRQLRRETARARQLEAELRELRGSKEPPSETERAHQAAQARPSPAAAPPRVWEEPPDLDGGLARSARSCQGRCLAERDDEDAAVDLGSPIDGSVGKVSCTGASAASSASAGATSGGPGPSARQRGGAPPTPRPAPAAERPWEFVIQGQCETEPQQDFAAKTVSCYPDDAVEQGLRRGVACICTRGRRLDSSVPNQDDFVAARHTLAHGGHIALYGVFDGFGPAGHHCAAFARGHLPESLFGQRALLLRPEDTLREAFRLTQEALLAQPFDSAHSGTAAVLCMVLSLPTLEGEDEDDRRAPSDAKGEAWLFVAHVGDSRAILASHSGADSSAFTVTALTRDHRPDDAEEAARVARGGGEVRRIHDGRGPPRVFARGRSEPALALTRCLGAAAASGSGVSAEPEVSAYRLRPGVDVLLVLGSDGLFEFCSNTHAVGQILKDGLAPDTLAALSESSRRQWAQGSCNDTVDDVTIVAAELPAGEAEAEARGPPASPRRR